MKYDDCRDVFLSVQNCFVAENVDEYQMLLENSAQAYLNTKLKRCNLDETFHLPIFQEFISATSIATICFLVKSS